MEIVRAFILRFLLCLLIICTSCAYAADRVTCYTAWDDAFLYVAVEVQDPDIIATNTTHMSNPWEDDAVEVFLETDNQRAPHRTPNTFQMSVSAGGGSSWVVGENGQPVPRKIFTFKYARKVQGTINRSDDRDIGYTIELAMPWREMGGPPAPGTLMGFNIICRMKGENCGFVSFSPEVKSEEDMQVPAKWGTIKPVNVPTVIAIEDGAVVCRKVITRAPLIDGNLSPWEWNRNMSFQMMKPEVSPFRPKQFLLEKLSFSHYFYWYQGDPRKQAPFGHVRYEDGSSMLTDKPLGGTGPWFSSDRVQWHKNELQDIRRAGIDVILPVYWGCASEKAAWADKGLNCLVQALKELKAEGKEYPLVGMFFDTSAMYVQTGGKPNLCEPKVQEIFYGMIRDFFLRIPEEFRAVIQVPPEKGGYRAHIVVLYTSSWFSDFDASFVEFCNSRFAQDFGDTRLVWIGSSDYRPKASVMDGYCSYGGGLGLRYDDEGWIDIAAVGAGYDDTWVKGRETPIRSRMDGDTYRQDWDKAMAKSPDWIFVDGWNEFHEGSDICASRQYGVKYIGLTRVNMLRFNGMREYDAKFIWHNTPSTMLPGGLYQITVQVRNAGTKPWYAKQGFFLAYRWYRDGVLFADTGARLPLQTNVLPGQTIEKTMGIRVADQDGKPLPEGNYELRWEITGWHDTWFSAGGDIPLCVPVKVGIPRGADFTLVTSTMPALAKGGATYNVKLRIRNDGSMPWNATQARVGYRWYALDAGIRNPSPGEIVGTPIPADVAPGRLVDVEVRVMVPDVGDYSKLQTRILKWAVFDGKEWLMPPELGKNSEAVAVTSKDYGPRFVTVTQPKEWAAGKPVPVEVTVENTGVETWTPGDFAIGYHWYYLDGIEAAWGAEKTLLPVVVKPGERVVVRTHVNPPVYDGQYYLVWDLAVGETWASTTDNTRGNDIMVLPVSVVKGKLTALDLRKDFDTDVISFDTNRKDGDFDGKGSTFPAEFMPPEASMISLVGALWPSGYWTTAVGSALESNRRISFRYPPKSDGSKNAITCKGQRLSVKAGRYAAVHLLASSCEDGTTDMGLAYGNTVDKQPIRASSWDKKPVDGFTAFVCMHRHSPSRDERGIPCYLTHFQVKADPSKELTGIILPQMPGLKVLAITLERP